MRKRTKNPALHRERVREAERKSSQRFWADKVTIDDAAKKGTPRDVLFSDRGSGVESMLTEIDGDEGDEEDNKPDEDAVTEKLNHYWRRRRWAQKLVSRKKPYCLETLNLVLQNGENREESIACLMKSPDTIQDATPHEGATTTSSKNSRRSSKRWRGKHGKAKKRRKHNKHNRKGSRRA